MSEPTENPDERLWRSYDFRYLYLHPCAPGIVAVFRDLDPNEKPWTESAFEKDVIAFGGYEVIESKGEFTRREVRSGPIVLDRMHRVIPIEMLGQPYTLKKDGGEFGTRSKELESCIVGAYQASKHAQLRKETEESPRFGTLCWMINDAIIRKYDPEQKTYREGFEIQLTAMAIQPWMIERLRKILGNDWHYTINEEFGRGLTIHLQKKSDSFRNMTK